MDQSELDSLADALKNLSNQELDQKLRDECPIDAPDDLFTVYQDEYAKRGLSLPQ